MTVDSLSGLVTWSPTNKDLADVPVILHAYDVRGGRAEQTFQISVAGGNHAPVVADLQSLIEGAEGQPLVIEVSANDPDGQSLRYWANGLPSGANFDPETRRFTWTPGGRAAGTYSNLSFHVSDGVAESIETVTILIAPTNQPVTLEALARRTVREGDPLHLLLRGEDQDGDEIRYAVVGAPVGALLNPLTGQFDWTPGYAQAGTYQIEFQAQSLGSTASRTMLVEVLSSNGAPIFLDATAWQVDEGQALQFNLRAFDPDNPAYIPPVRLPDGTLSPLTGSAPSVTYTVEGLPPGATYDADTGAFAWTPAYTQAGRYSIVFHATDEGGGTGRALSTSAEVVVRVVNVNRPPDLATVENVKLGRGDVREIDFVSQDPDGNPIHWDLLNESPGYPLPGFITFTAGINGTARMRLAPGAGDRGAYPLLLKASDNGDGEGAALTTTRSFVVTVDVPNEAPQFVAVADRVAVVGQPFHLILQVQDPDQEELTLTNEGLPNGMTIQPAGPYGTWFVDWTPDSTTTQAYVLRWRVHDTGNGNSTAVAEDVLEFALAVRTQNQAPTLSAVPALRVAEGAELHWSLQANDPDGDPLVYRGSALPAGLQIDPISGELRWTPGYRQAGTYSIIAEATDGTAVATRGITIEVLNTNLAPQIVDMPTRYVREGRFLSFTMAGGDPDEEATVIEPITQLPSGAVFKPDFRRFEWDPTYDQAGEYVVQFRIRDVWGGSETTEVHITVDNVNRAPAPGTSDHSARLGALLRFHAQATDPDLDDTLHFRAENLPVGAAFDPATGEFQWVPGPGQAGDHTFTLAVSDGHTTVSEVILIRASVDPALPEVAIEVTPSFPMTPGQPVLLHAAADSLGRITVLTLEVNGSPLPLDAQGRATLTPSQPGRYRLTATATDIDGLVGTAERWLLVKDPADASAPVVTLDPNLQGTVIQATSPILGTIADANLESWQLTLERLDGVFYRVLATGTTVKSGDALATLDPATLPRGFYRIELSAKDISGRSTATTAVFEVSVGTAGGGRYLREELDLTLDFGSRTFGLKRLYDAWGPVDGELSGGWSLGSRDPDPQFSLPAGALERYNIYPALRDGTRLYLTLPDGERVGFTFKPVAVGTPGMAVYQPNWVADAGVHATLETLRVPLQRAGQGYYELGTGQPYHPGNAQLPGPDFVVRAANGRTWWLDFDGGVRRELFSDGSWMEFADSGLVSSTGVNARFSYDGEGHVQTVRGPADETLTYRYDEAGHLTQVITSTGNSIRYGYEPGDAGLLVAVAPASGPAIAITHGTAPRETVLGGGFHSFEALPSAPITGIGATAGSPIGAVWVSNSSLRSTLSSSVLVQVQLETLVGAAPPVVPTLARSARLSLNQTGNRVTAVFELGSPGAYILSAGAQALANAALTWSLVGDLNGDSRVDGTDAGLLDAAQGSVRGDAGYVSRGDLEQDGDVDAQDRFLLIRNYGFAPAGTTVAPVIAPNQGATQTALGWRNPRASLDVNADGRVTELDIASVQSHLLVRGTGALASPNYGQAFVDVDGDGNLSAADLALVEAAVRRPGLAGNTGSVAGSDSPNTGAAAGQAATGDFAAWLSGVSGSALPPITGLRNGTFFFDDLNHPAFGWVLRGEVLVQNHKATLTEDGSKQSGLLQLFHLPAWATGLEMTLDSVVLGATAGLPPDAFEVALLDATTGLPLVGTVAGVPHSDASLNIQASGVMTLSTKAQVTPVSNPNGTRKITLDLSGLASDTLAVLFLDLLGFGARESRVTVSNVRLLGNPPPVAANDVASTAEDTPTRIIVLGNDSDSDNAINLASVSITAAPQHGIASVDPVTGVITYTPDPNYSGTDTMVYTVEDLGGTVSNAATLTVTVVPVADAPVVFATAVNGQQDSKLALNLFAQLADRDGSESLLVILSGVPTGSLLSGGRQVANGVYYLTEDELAGLTWTPAFGQSGEFTFNVQAVATEAANASSASTSTTQRITVDIASRAPLLVEDFKINGGDMQRSSINSLDVRFSEDVFIGRPELDVTIARIQADGTVLPAINIPSDRYHYTIASKTLRIDLHGLVTEDGHYRFALNTREITSVRSANVTLLDADFDPTDGLFILGFHRLLSDFTGDDLVDRNDYDELTKHYRSEQGEAKYHPDFDLDSDGKIDREDYGIWRNQDGRTTDVFKPVVGVTLEKDSGVDPTDRITNDPTLTGFAADTSSLKRLEISFNGGAWQSILNRLENSRFSLSRETINALAGRPLVDGTQQIRVRAIDRFDLASETFELSFVLDTVAPAKPGTPDLLPGSDTGSKSDDNVTSSRSPVLRVVAEDGSLVRLMLDGSEVANGVASGAVDLEVNSLGLFPGSQTWTATAEDLAGNVSATSAGLLTVFDPDAANVSSFGLAPESDTAPVGDGRTTSGTINLVGKTEPGAVVRLLKTGAEVIADSAGSFRFTNVSINYGANTLAIMVTDVAGNTKDSQTTVTRVGPETEAPVLNAALARDTGRSSTDRLTNDPAIRGAVVDASSPARFDVRINGGEYHSVLAKLSNSAFELSLADLVQLNGGSLPDGAYDVEFVAADIYGNTSGTLRYSFVLDTAAPAIPSKPDLVSTSDTGTFDNDNLTSALNWLIQVRATNGDWVRLFVDTTTVERLVADGVANFDQLILVEGAHLLMADAVDAAGNISAKSGVLTVALDRTAPVLPTFDLSPGSDTGTLGDHATNIELVTLVGVTEPGALATLSRSSEPLLVLGETTADSSGAFVFVNIALAGGANILIVTARDAAGNERQATQTITAIVPDTTPPVIHVELMRDTGWSATDHLTSDPTLVGRVVDASAITVLRAGVDSDPIADVRSRLNGGLFQFTAHHLELIRGAPLGDGVHLVKLQAVDAAGNVSEVAQFEFSLDTTPPLPPTQLALAGTNDTGKSSVDGITSLSAFRVVATAPAGTRVAFYMDGALAGTVNASDAIGIDVGPLSDGTHRFKATAEDAAGNTSAFAVPFDVLVDTTAPTITSLALAPGYDTFPVGDGITNVYKVVVRGETSPGASVVLIGTELTAVANASGVFELAGVRLVPGVNQLQVRSQDAAGNTATRTLPVEFRDTAGPLLSARLTQDTGLSDSDSITQIPNILLSVEDGSAITHFRVGLNDKPLQDRLARLSNNEWIITADDLAVLLGQPTLQDGFYNLVVEAVDVSGNASGRFSFAFLLDRAAPLVSRPDLLATSDTGFSDTDNITSDDTPSVRTNLERGVMVRWYLDGQLHDSRLLTNSQEYLFGELTDGTHNVAITAEDVAGNLSQLSPGLTLLIDTHAPSTPTLDLDASSDSVPLHDWKTVSTVVTLAGVTGSLDRVRIVGTGKSAVASQDGTFVIGNIQLQPRNNTFTVRIEDAAGNAIDVPVAIWREPAPVVLASVNGTPTETGAYRNLTVSGQVSSGNGISAFEAWFDGTPETKHANIFTSLVDGAFTFDLEELIQIRGAPLPAGSVNLNLRAADQAGLKSEVKTVAFTFDPAPLTDKHVTVTHDSATGQFIYRYDLGNPIANGARTSVGQASYTIAEHRVRLHAEQVTDRWLFAEFTVFVPNNAALTNFITPTGWSLDYTSGSTQAHWTADTSETWIEPGQFAQFGFQSPLPQGQAPYEATAQNVSNGDQRTLGGFVAGPVSQSGFAVADYYQVNADETLFRSGIAIDALLHNDRLIATNTILQAIPLRSASHWGVAIRVTAEGEFWYGITEASGPGKSVEAIFGGLLEGESIVDQFQYTVMDTATGIEEVAAVFVTVTGVNNAPEGTPDGPITTRATQVAEIKISKLVENDTDPDTNDSVHFLDLASGKSDKGAEIRIVDDKVIYDPRDVDSFANLLVGQYETDFFKYRVADKDGAHTEVRVEIRVYGPQNRPPIILPATIETDEDNPIRILPIAFAIDPDAFLGGSDLRVTFIGASNLGAKVELLPDGTIWYDPTVSELLQKLGSNSAPVVDRLTVTVTDSTNGATGELAIRVLGRNDRPTAVDLTFEGADEDSVFIRGGLFAKVEDVDGADPLIDTIRSASISKRGIPISWAADVGQFLYDPRGVLDWLPQGESIEDSFAYTVDDQHGGSATATITLKIKGVNDVPLAVPETVRQGYFTVSGDILSVNVPYGLLKNDQDVDRGEKDKLMVQGLEPNQSIVIQSDIWGAEVRVYGDGRFVYYPGASLLLGDRVKRGLDSVDRFSYWVQDTHSGRSLVTFAEVMVLADYAGYSFDIVAREGEEGIVGLGRGPSINNFGDIGFKGSVENAKKQPVDDLFVWLSENKKTKSLISEKFVQANLPDNNTDAVPTQIFSESVQLNDSGLLIAQRRLDAVGLLGNVMFGFPALTTTPVMVTYVESWNVNADKSVSARQLGAGDLGLSSAGIRWGNPYYLELLFGGLSPLLGGGILAAAATGVSLAYVPTMHLLDPIWAGLFFSRLSGGGDYFNFVYPSVSISNTGHSAFAASVNPKQGSGNYLVTTPHERNDGITQLGVGTPGFIAAPRIADDGTIVLRNERDGKGELFVLPFDLNLRSARKIAGPSSDPLEDFQEIGAYPAISDDGSLVAFFGVHRLLGRGIFVADPTTGKWSKVIGQSGDGWLDPGERYDDVNGNGRFDQGSEVDVGALTEIQPNDAGVGLELAIQNLDVPQPLGHARYEIMFSGAQPCARRWKPRLGWVACRRDSARWKIPTGNFNGHCRRQD
jgi:YD repeat-containing protein